ncbi:MAG: hypothetical protein JWP94_638 [Mucilaginibacter sp.]|nr:hypothetical protein [Mucilaginibacter sp.]
MKSKHANPLPQKELSAEQIAKLRLDIRHFFLNYSKKKVKRNLWNLFKGWTYSEGAGGGNAPEISDMLLFYQELLAFITDVKKVS